MVIQERALKFLLTVEEFSSVFLPVGYDNKKSKVCSFMMST